MKRIWLVASLVALIAGSTFGQGANDKDQHTDAVLAKIRQVDLLFNILPALYTKDQLNKLLPALEKARAEVRKARDVEYSEYLKLEPELDACIANALDKNVLPAKTTADKWTKTYGALLGMRQLTIAKEIMMVRPVMDDVLTKTQLKVIANMVDPRVYDPRAKPDEMTQDEKITIYIREILLDPLTYDLLVKMSMAK